MDIAVVYAENKPPEIFLTEPAGIPLPVAVTSPVLDKTYETLLNLPPWISRVIILSLALFV